jgi:methylated-DNA-protein-cysteine methyltransferase related protein
MASRPASKPASAKPVSTKTAIKRIHAAIRAIPPGSVAGYGVVAHRAGLPGRARLVARVLSNNDDPTLPWHRVLRSDGRIAFPPDSDGYAEQIQRLRAEGVAVEAGRVRGMQRAADSLDALLWAPPQR